jgi:hypothetical protein
VDLPAESRPRKSSRLVLKGIDTSHASGAAILPVGVLSHNTLVVIKSGTPSTQQDLDVSAALSCRLQHIMAALAPVIGEVGVAALYQRSLEISSRVYPWLAAPEDCYRGGMDLDELKLLITRQSDAVAAAGAAFLLKTFHDQFEGLVGSAVARQLIDPSANPRPPVKNREQFVAKVKRLWGV